MSKSARNKNARNKNARSGNAKKNALTQPQVPWGGIAFFTVIGVVAVFAISYAFLQTRSSAADGGSSIAGVVARDDLSRDHTTDDVDYPDAPPMGGEHDPMWQNCDGIVYDRALRDENAVHSLEHGAVWVTHRPDLAAGQVEALREKVESTSYTFMSPYPSQDSPITLTAWGSRLDLQDAGDGRLDEFLRAFVKGPQTPEPGAACTGAKAAP
ncbi:DUF3105 domain-containing protein [Actinomadura sp. WMMB 499]|uniref:DUF3105 domain-containing protein n=1 Tax=Actinomadura sp. WMMB 499 TaxID=1219491 RepID=UPI001247F283|nr:DUF3105 domain-containing protein [Actinomadura sp. WMMB 499]QFG26451.1 DUF3105 domain-containing protein [Actinomadura sp. WMMB 499]